MESLDIFDVIETDNPFSPSFLDVVATISSMNGFSFPPRSTSSPSPSPSSMQVLPSPSVRGSEVSNPLSRTSSVPESTSLFIPTTSFTDVLPHPPSTASDADSSIPTTSPPPAAGSKASTPSLGTNVKISISLAVAAVLLVAAASICIFFYVRWKKTKKIAKQNLARRATPKEMTSEYMPSSSSSPPPPPPSEKQKNDASGVTMAVGNAGSDMHELDSVQIGQSPVNGPATSSSMSPVSLWDPQTHELDGNRLSELPA